MASAKWRPFCLGLNVLTQSSIALDYTASTSGMTKGKYASSISEDFAKPMWFPFLAVLSQLWQLSVKQTVHHFPLEIMCFDFDIFCVPIFIHLSLENAQILSSAGLICW